MKKQTVHNDNYLNNINNYNNNNNKSFIADNCPYTYSLI